MGCQRVRLAQSAAKTNVLATKRKQVIACSVYKMKVVDRRLADKMIFAVSLFLFVGENYFLTNFSVPAF